MQRRFLSMLVAVVLTMIMLPVPAMAEITEKWSDYADTSWYNTTDTSFTVSTAAQLAGVAKIINGGTSDFKGIVIELGADIDLAGKCWIPIGDSSHYSRFFKGEFDGNGHTISNMYIDGSKLGGKNGGLFGTLGRGAQTNNALRAGGYVHDFTVYNTTIEKATKQVAVVASNVYHDCVMENIVVDTAVLTGTSSVSAITTGVQSSQFKNILVKNVTLNANGGGEIGALFTSAQGTLYPYTGLGGASVLGYYASGYALPGTVMQDSDNNPKNNPVINNYFENIDAQNVTLNVKGSNSYVGGFVAYNLDYAGDAMICIDCDITGLEINVISGSPIVGGFAGLRAGVMNVKYTNTDGESVTLKGYDGCSVEGEINGLGGKYGGFIGESRFYAKGNSATDMTYYDVTTDVDITANAGATVGGFAAYMDTSIQTAGRVVPQSLSGVTVLGTTALGGAAPVGSSIIGTGKTATGGDIGFDDCYTAGTEELETLWQEAYAADPTLDEAQWKMQKIRQLMIGNWSGTNILTDITGKIVFDTRGGSKIAAITQAFGTAVTEPAAPTRKGYTFAGWDKEIPSVMPPYRMTVTAVWVRDLPATGDNMPIALYAGLMGGMAVALCVLLRKKKTV